MCVNDEGGTWRLETGKVKGCLLKETDQRAGGDRLTDNNGERRRRLRHGLDGVDEPRDADDLGWNAPCLSHCHAGPSPTHPPNINPPPPVKPLPTQTGKPPPRPRPGSSAARSGRRRPAAPAARRFISLVEFAWSHWCWGCDIFKKQDFTFYSYMMNGSTGSQGRHVNGSQVQSDVERKWEIDEPLIRKRLSELKNPHDPLWLAVFPEGTDYTEKKCIKSQEYAAEHGLPILNNVLLPKTKGFNCCLQELRGSIDSVYDITIAYKHRLPTFLDNVYGIDPSEVHIHVKIIQLSDIPASEDEVADWLIERFELKDKLLSDFSTLGCFPNEGTESELSTLKCAANFVAVICTTSILMYLTMFSSVWFKIFVVFSSALLTIATYYSIHLPQLLCSPEAGGTHAKKP
ncbi:hypothetical protein GUJ93_ZPchr0005g14525 [Zizania palustris]|uniref:1-acylglycerol-3-phosphate O-acyltransferase n=1 Tax=Zizania palustris TaxID=103762 RepID=A0A8J5W159_ZIZPA|nr:hypothetical protein GUJ93_ZPchr0005g14525 [Zizania palustris]